jgi:fatty acid desaturase
MPSLSPHWRTKANALRVSFAAQAHLHRARGSTACGLLLAALHVGAGALAAAANVAVWRWEPVAAALLYPVTVFWIGSRFRAIGNMVHECAHRTLVRSRSHNRGLGELLAFVDFTAFAAYKDEHLSHHRHLGDAARDRDYAVRKDLFEHGPGRSFLARHLLRPLTLFHVQRYIEPVLWRRADPWTVKAARLTYNLGLVALAWATGWIPFLLFYLVPYATAYQVFRYWSDAVDHAGALSNHDELDRARNHVHRWAPVNWLLFPRDDQFHLVHHLFPSVPTGSLATLHRVLLADPSYAGRDHTFEALFTEDRS